MAQLCWNLDGVILTKKDLQWTFSEAQNEQLPFNTPKLVYEAGRIASKVWELDDDTFCKSKWRIPGTTLEHVTLEYVREHHPGFKVPNVHHYEVYNGRYYIILSRVRGSTLKKAWPTMDDTDKDKCVRRMADMCVEMKNWRAGGTISGIDGHNLSEQFLSAESANIENITADDLSPSKLLVNCQAIGLNCSQLVFYHCDLGPGNVIVDENSDITGIIDWESAGWVPEEWVRTKFRVSSGLDLDDFQDTEQRIDWRKRVQLELEAKKFPEAAERWLAWRGTL